MKPSGIPADASCVIYLAKADGITAAAGRFGPLLLPPGVWAEVVHAGERRASPEVPRILTAVEARLIARVRLDSAIARRARHIAREFRLGTGESEVLALGTRSRRVLLDDHRAAGAGGNLGVLTVESVLVPALCAGSGVLDRTQALALLDRLAQHMDLTNQIWVRVRNRIMEATS